jgi:protein-tyrosine phosphatase
VASDGSWTRRLAWEGCRNARDLGGYATFDGRETRWAAIIRSEVPSSLTEAGRAALVAYGVRTIVDLRRPDEVERQPNPFAQAGPHGVAYANVPFEDGALGSPVATGPVELYRGLLDSHPLGVAAVLTSIARAPDGGVLVHCFAGQDRTGLISALLLELVGVAREVIAADYALTAECMHEGNEQWLENGPGERAERERILRVFAPRPEVMIASLAYLDERYGGSEAYLVRAGVTPGDLARLRERLVPGSSADIAASRGAPVE